MEITGLKEKGKLIQELYPKIEDEYISLAEKIRRKSKKGKSISCRDYVKRLFSIYKHLEKIDEAEIPVFFYENFPGSEEEFERYLNAPRGKKGEIYGELAPKLYSVKKTVRNFLGIKDPNIDELKKLLEPESWERYQRLINEAGQSFENFPETN